MDELQGVWALVSHEYKGEQLHQEAIRLGLLKLILEGQRYTIKAGCRVIIAEGFRTNPTANPKQFDLVRTLGGGKEWSVPGIYKLEDGLLTIGLGLNRPSGFMTSTDLNQSVAVYRKV